MSEANQRQHGGSHYKKGGYEHWDWVYDIRLGYLPACASKYAFRYPEKAGALDVQKAIHYLDKAIEVGAPGSNVAKRHTLFWKFLIDNNVTMQNAVALWYIMEGQFAEAKEVLQVILEGLPQTVVE